ncbi:hypothetical protein FGG08_007253, partial [Glutinoglossum americanum]
MPSPLLTAVDCTAHVHLVVGAGPLAAARCTRSLEAGARPKVVAPADAEVHCGLKRRVEDGEVEWVGRAFRDEDLRELGREEEVGGVVDAVFVTVGARDPLTRRKRERSTDGFPEGIGARISALCRRLRIPVNVADAPALSTFSLLSTHTDGPLQIGVTTSGKGCKLASRIRREVASSLPPGLGRACERFGDMRRRIREEDEHHHHHHHLLHGAELDVGDEDEDMGQGASFNALVTPEDQDAARGRRIRWLGQIC